MVKNLPAVQETWVWPLGWEDALEKEMATHSNILAGEIPCGGHKVGHDLATKQNNLSGCAGKSLKLILR